MESTISGKNWCWQAPHLHPRRLTWNLQVIFIFIPNESSKYQVENHKLPPHGEVFRSKWILLISKNIYHFLWNSKPLNFQHQKTVAVDITLDFRKSSIQCDRIAMEKARKAQMKLKMSFWVMHANVSQRCGLLALSVTLWATTAPEPNLIHATVSLQIYSLSGADPGKFCG